MLYDKRWDRQVKADPLTLPAFIAWLEQQPADETYNYFCTDGTCLLDRYISAATGKPSRPDPDTHWKTCGGPERYVQIAGRGPWTYGAALARARTALSSAE